MHPLAGHPAPADLLIDVAALERAYDDRRPDPAVPVERVSFGTSGHRGTPGNGSFTAAHIRAITQAICEYRAGAGITGPLFVGKDTHALSRAAERTAVEVLEAGGVDVVVQWGDGYTPTPVVSHAILQWNRGRETGNGKRGEADGIVITPSHNPPEDGGFKYNPPNGGPADTDVTTWIQDRANQILIDTVRATPCGRPPAPAALLGEEGGRPSKARPEDLTAAYVDDLATAIDFDAIRGARLRIGVDPMGGASLAAWGAIRDRYGLDLTIVNDRVDPRFGFMTVDHDGRIRMDCSSPAAMASLVGLKDRFDIACGNDPDADRHGIVTPSVGLMNPNHFLAVAIHYLLGHRPGWPAGAAVGKTLVSSAIIDRVVAAAGRTLLEVPVGFKWFTPGLFDGTVCFGGEESAGASFLRRDGGVWTTDKDGILLCLLAAEITAVTGRDPGDHYRDLTARHGAPVYTRIDTPCTPAEKAGFKRLIPEAVAAPTLAGDPITARLTRAAGNGASIGGLKVTTDSGWFAARPSGTENVYKLYAESFRDAGHLARIVVEARTILSAVLSPA